MLTTNYSENLNIMERCLNTKDSFDLVERKITIKNRKAVMYFSDGLTKDEIAEKLMEFIYKNTSEDDFKNADTFSQNCVPYIEVETSGDEEKITTDVLSGICALLIEGFDKAVLIDIRTYPQRRGTGPAASPACGSPKKETTGPPPAPAAANRSLRHSGHHSGGLSPAKRPTSQGGV